MQPPNERLQHLESEINDVRKRVHRLETDHPKKVENDGDRNRPASKHLFEKINAALMSAILASSSTALLISAVTITGKCLS